MSKVCAIHQPNFLPWAGYFHKMATADVFIFLDNVDIVTGSAKAITHRTRILSPQGALWLSLPFDKGRSKHICDLGLKKGTWREKMLKTVRQFYANAPRFDEVYPLFEECLATDESNLARFNIRAIRKTADFLGIETPTLIASEIPVESTDRSERITEICRHAGADTYLSGKGGLAYHEAEVFRESRIRITHIPFAHPRYPQQHGDGFEQGLSIFDMLFNSDQTQTLFSSTRDHEK